jgi:hypothetical protein
VVEVSARLTGLSAHTTYRYRLAASNSYGSSTGEIETFTTLPDAPTVTTGSATVATTSATLTASVDGNGGTLSACDFEWGTTTVSENSVSCSPGSGPQEVSATVSGLSPHTTYSFRIVATNEGGPSAGEEQTFTTLAAAPTVSLDAAPSVTQTSAIVSATVNPNNESITQCEIDYGPTTSYGSSVPCEPSPGAGGLPVAVSTSLPNLSSGTTYYFCVIAANDAGASECVSHTFTTTLPTTPQQQTLARETGPPSGSPPPQQQVAAAKQAKPPSLPDARLMGTSLTATPAGMVSVKVSCPAAETSCIGTVTLRILSSKPGTAVRSRKQSKPAMLMLASSVFDAIGGHVATIKLRLSPAVRALLARAHVLHARATVFAHDAAGATYTMQTLVTIRAAKTLSRS